MAVGDDATIAALADLTVLSGDPLTTPAERLLEIQVAQTWGGGGLAYEA